HTLEALPKVIIFLNPSIEYVNGKNTLKLRNPSGNIWIGKSEPVVDNCNTANINAIKRPIFPATSSTNKTTITNVKLTKIENEINFKLLCTSNLSMINEYKEIINACAIAKVASTPTLPINHATADGGKIVGRV